MAILKRIINSIKKFFGGKKKRSSRGLHSPKRLCKKTQKKNSCRKKDLRGGAKKSRKKVFKKPKEVLAGEITHFFSRICVGVVKMTHGNIKTGDSLHLRGKSTSFVQKVESLQIESREVNIASKGKLVGLKLSQAAKPGDKVYKIIR